MSEAERRVAESDAYLRHLAQKTEKNKKDKVKKQIKEGLCDDGVELSQMSSWSDEAMFNI